MIQKRRRINLFIGSVIPVAFLLCGLISCASYQGQIEQSRSQLSTDPKIAAEQIKEKAFTEGKDQLVYLLDYATAEQQAQNYDESNKAFLAADKMAELKDYTSLSKQALSLALNQEQIQYSGDDYEKVMINAMLAINFLMKNDLDSALVETRRINEKLEYFRREEKKPYTQDPFAVYLSAVVWEANRNFDDAYIAYEKAYSLAPEIPYLKQDLVRSAIRAQRPDKVEKWRQLFGIKNDPTWDDRKYGEVVLIYQQGWGPRKYPRKENHRFPELFPQYSVVQQAVLQVKGKVNANERTQTVLSVEDVAIKTLNDSYGILMAKHAGGLVTKAVLADQVRQKDKALGDLTWILLNVADRADLRQWSTLPQTFQIARLRVPPGDYTAIAQGVGGSESSPEMKFSVKAGRKVFLGWRSFQ